MDHDVLNKRSLPATEQRLDALLEQQRRQCDSMDRIASAMEVMVTTSMTIALIYPWKADPSIVRAVLLRSDHDRHQLRESMSRFETSDRSMSVEDWLEKDGFFVVKTESIFLDRHGVGMFLPRAAAAHTELIPPHELDPSLVLRLQRDVEAEEAAAAEEAQLCESEADRALHEICVNIGAPLPTWSARARPKR